MTLDDDEKGDFMAVQRELWKVSFLSWPTLPCPRCGLGALTVPKDSISKEEPAWSEALRGHDAWEPEWIVRRFIAILTCANPSCGEKVAACGEVELEWYYDYGPDGKTITVTNDRFIPRFFEPALPVFPIPENCPKEVKDELKKAFALIWSDAGSSGNRLRVAVEALLNERGVQKKAKIKKGQNKGKYRELKLHGRIERFAEREKDAATQLMAIKWLGNTGSHTALEGLTHDDLLGAFEHFEYALDLVYVKKGPALAKLARAINKKKGPVRAKRNARPRPSGKPECDSLFSCGSY